MASGKGLRVRWCPIEQGYCHASCYFRFGDRCRFKSRHGRLVKELTRRKKAPDG